MQKKVLFVLTLAIGIAFVWSCSKSSTGSSTCEVVPPANEKAAIQAYIAEKDLEGVQFDESGLFYQISDPGIGGSPNLSSKIYIKYKGYLTDGTVFDEQTDPSQTGWVLGTLINGWKIGLPKLKKGGKMKLIVPSALGYGCRGSGATIPPNSVLVFDVELSDYE
ncbi:FKBP-type peptidyl-prolyl cis-trans isomerase [Flavihumibacter petaseus]|uniref:Peptidyl-prolyl cis-trans isomerase n=1 Tax=Flavihumibacter petaseus NBRC 106054 TaxID=1220578 RepID=A0A0E9N3C9_9BACT|nr:FKBP-type peptidyl-prolyl cis-trans isomerase [Flavihumibacter petaseus]GAO44339.1 FKBP-type peptidyl-prolyl cis-trans isomerase [Flavihumibacter petaseus NBRC 106054]